MSQKGRLNAQASPVFMFSPIIRNVDTGLGTCRAGAHCIAKKESFVRRHSHVLHDAKQPPKAHSLMEVIAKSAAGLKRW